MKIGVTHRLYKVKVTKSDGITVNLLLSQESYDYLVKIAKPCYHFITLLQPEYVIVDRLDTDSLEDLFKDETWL